MATSPEELSINENASANLLTRNPIAAAGPSEVFKLDPNRFAKSALACILETLPPLSLTIDLVASKASPIPSLASKAPNPAAFNPDEKDSANPPKSPVFCSTTLSLSITCSKVSLIC